MTGKCNLTCDFCDGAPKEYAGSKLKDVLAGIDKLVDAGLTTLNISGGEPLVRKDTPQTIAYARSKGIEVYLSTNAVFDGNNPPYKENDFLGINHLPSLNLNAIQTMLSLRLLAFNVLDNFRHDLDPEYSHKTLDLIYREFVDGVQGRVQLTGDTIIVNVYAFKHEHAVASILTNLEAKLKKANIDPRIPWLGNRRLEFKFY